MNKSCSAQVPKFAGLQSVAALPVLIVRSAAVQGPGNVACEWHWQNSGTHGLDGPNSIE